MDMVDMNRKFPGMVFNNQYQNQNQHQSSMPQSQTYPVVSSPPAIVGMLPQDYQRWMAEQSFQQIHQQQMYGSGHQRTGYDQRLNQSQQQNLQQQNNNSNNRNNSFCSHQYSLSGDNRVSTSRSPTPPSVELCASPKFGPGPPIVTSERVKGPRGCNLFVFHLPNEITNWSVIFILLIKFLPFLIHFHACVCRDMYLLFRRFGTILSVHTMVNKSTGLSKGFGFVSYSAQQEAHAAISEMDGFRVRSPRQLFVFVTHFLLLQLGKKRLKVQLKRSQDDEDDGSGIEVDDSDVFYPTKDMQLGHHQSPRGHPVRASRQTSCDSMASSLNDASTSGHTTRASTPRGARAGSAAAEGCDHYFEGVDSDDPHSPNHDQTSSMNGFREGVGGSISVTDRFGQMSVNSTSVSAGAVVVSPLVIIPPETIAPQQTPLTPPASRKTMSGGKKRSGVEGRDGNK
jgi:hypothetical protein